MKKANKIFIICCSLLCTSCSVSKSETKKCTEHTGKEVCSVCGINYFETTCNYLKTLKYNSGYECYYDTTSTYTDGGNKLTFKISYYPKPYSKSDFICLEATETELQLPFYARLYLYDAAGIYEYRLVRTTGGMLTGKLYAEKFPEDVSAIDYDYCSFSGAGKPIAMAMATIWLDTCVKSFGTIIKTQNLSVRNFGFDNYQ